MTSPSEAKAALRAALRARRDGLPAAARAAWSQHLAEHGLAALRERVQPGTVVSAYWPMRSEADPRPLAQALAALGATLALPAFTADGMVFRAWRDEDPLVPAGFQTHEPPATAPVVVPAVVLAPLLAFDRRGGRLGWGKGYYDTYLAARAAAGAGPFVVGVAFACQQVDAVPVEAHDQRVHAVVSERGWWPC